jgi:TonB family protein
VATRKRILALVLLPYAVLAADAQPGTDKPVAVTHRIEVETNGQVPLDAYNGSVNGKTAQYCERQACDRPPMLLSATAPIYPRAALRAEIEGRAIVVFDVNATGAPINLVVESATAPEFGKAALVAVRAWRFQPAVLGGKPIEYRNFRQSFPFELRD